eukprot:718985-Rhodomonas_salina.1
MPLYADDDLLLIPHFSNASERAAAQHGAGAGGDQTSSAKAAARTSEFIHTQRHCAVFASPHFQFLCG